MNSPLQKQPLKEKSSEEENDHRRRPSHQGIDLMDLSLEHFQGLSSTPGLSTSRECAAATAEAFQFGMDLSHSACTNDGYTTSSVRRKQRQNSLSPEDLKNFQSSTTRTSRRQSHHSENHSQSYSQLFYNWLSPPTKKDKTVNLMDHSAPDEIYLHNSMTSTTRKRTPRRKPRKTTETPDSYHLPSPPFLRRSNSNESAKTSTSTILRLRKQYQQEHSKEKQQTPVESLQAALDEKDKVIELLRQQLAQQKQGKEGTNHHSTSTPLMEELWNSLRNMTHHNTPVTNEDPYIPSNWQLTPQDYQDKINRLQAKLDTALANQQAAEQQVRERDLLIQTMQKQAQQHHELIDGLQKTHQDIVHEIHVEWHNRLTQQAAVFQKRFDKAVALLEQKHLHELQDRKKPPTKATTKNTTKIREQDESGGTQQCTRSSSRKGI